MASIDSVIYQLKEDRDEIQTMVDDWKDKPNTELIINYFVGKVASYNEMIGLLEDVQKPVTIRTYYFMRN